MSNHDEKVLLQLKFSHEGNPQVDLPLKIGNNKILSDIFPTIAENELILFNVQLMNCHEASIRTFDHFPLVIKFKEKDLDCNSESSKEIPITKQTLINFNSIKNIQIFPFLPEYSNFFFSFEHFEKKEDEVFEDIIVETEETEKFPFKLEEMLLDKEIDVSDQLLLRKNENLQLINHNQIHNVESDDGKLKNEMIVENVESEVEKKIIQGEEVQCTMPEEKEGVVCILRKEECELMVGESLSISPKSANSIKLGNSGNSEKSETSKKSIQLENSDYQKNDEKMSKTPKSQISRKNSQISQNSINSPKSVISNHSINSDKPLSQASLSSLSSQDSKSRKNSLKSQTSQMEVEKHESSDSLLPISLPEPSLTQPQNIIFSNSLDSSLIPRKIQRIIDDYEEEEEKLIDQVNKQPQTTISLSQPVEFSSNPIPRQQSSSRLTRSFSSNIILEKPPVELLEKKRKRGNQKSIQEPLETINSKVNVNIKNSKNSTNNINPISITSTRGRRKQQISEATQRLPCSICLETMKNISRLDGCEHEFCKECIDQWAVLSNQCPLCKKEFKKIIYWESHMMHEQKVKKRRFKYEEDEEEPWYNNCAQNCMVCAKNNDEHLLLVCDKCMYNICHTYCAGLDLIPDEDWLCADCVAGQTRRGARGRREENVHEPTSLKTEPNFMRSNSKSNINLKRNQSENLNFSLSKSTKSGKKEEDTKNINIPIKYKLPNNSGSNKRNSSVNFNVNVNLQITNTENRKKKRKIHFLGTPEKSKPLKTNKTGKNFEKNAGKRAGKTKSKYSLRKKTKKKFT